LDDHIQIVPQFGSTTLEMMVGSSMISGLQTVSFRPTSDVSWPEQGFISKKQSSP
jgi:hypothetical protein